MRTFKEILREYEELKQSMPSRILESGLKDKFLITKLEMSKASYYKRKKDPSLWKESELVKASKIFNI